MAELRDNSAELGLNTNSTISQVKKGQVTYALNAQIEGFDGQSLTYQNEQANTFCCQFPKGFKVIGNYSIIEKDMVVFWITNPSTGDCQIGRMLNRDCVYRVDIDSPCLNFSINHPIKKAIHKITNCTIEVYWTDRTTNGRRFIDFMNLPYQTEIVGNSTDPCDVVTTSNIDCNKLSVQPNFAIPQIDVVEISSEGATTAGTYQFAFQYCNSLGEEYTSYYSITNPIPLNDPNKVTPDFNYVVNKAIQIVVSDIDITGVFDYFNIAVIKTINNITSVDLVATYQIEQATQTIIYAGQSKEGIVLTIDDIFEKFPVWDSADAVTTVQDIAIWSGMTSKSRISYQKIFNQVHLQWVAWRISNAAGNFADPIIANKYRGYMRDEVYPFDAVILSKKGYQSDRFPIPGRAPLASDLEYVSNGDTQFTQSQCDTPVPMQRWQVYNTASVSGQNFTPCVNQNRPPDPNNPSNLISFTVNERCTQDVACQGTGLVSLIFTLPSPLTQPLGVFIGVQWTRFGVNYYQGSNIFTPSAGYVPNTHDYSGNYQVPFLITIPAGVTTFQLSHILLQGSPNPATNTWICGCHDIIDDLFFQATDGVTQLSVISGDTWTPHAVNSPQAADTTKAGSGNTTQSTQQADCSNDDCYVGPFQYGEFSYWESTETYPCNEAVWGDLAGKPIRHHKFPDSAVTHHYDSEGNIYPLGVKLDMQALWELIRNSPDLTQEEKDDIAAIKIVHGNRANSKSIIAKGLYYNVGKYTQQQTNYYYPNYPYNDLNADPFISVASNQPVLQNTLISDVVVANQGSVETILNSITYTNAQWQDDAQMVYNGTFFGDPSVTKEIKLKLLGNNDLSTPFDSGLLPVGDGDTWSLSLFTSFIQIVHDGGINNNKLQVLFAVTFTIKGNLNKTITTNNSAYLDNNTTFFTIASGTSPISTLNLIGQGTNTHDLTVDNVVGGILTIIPEVGQLEGFSTDESKMRYSFISPDTEFNQPFLGNIMKLETAEFGNSFSHFTQVKQHSRYKFPSLDSYLASLVVGVVIGFASGTYGTSDNVFNGTAAFTAFTVFNDIIFKLLPRKNFAYSFNSVGSYTNYKVIPNDIGNKIRQLDIAAYLVPGMQGVGDTNIINNYQRESSVYVRTTTTLPFVSDDTTIPEDISRFNLGTVGCQNNIYERPISAYYGSIKDIVPDQYGLIYSYDTVDTGFQFLMDLDSPFDPNNQYQFIFGGDTFINRFALKRKLPFFLDNRVNFPDDADIAYEEVPNIAFTTYWFSTDITKGSGGNFSIGQLFGVKVNNFDCKKQDSSFFYDAGKIYLFAYGIPYFYVESQINVDYRQATDVLQGDFYPRVGAGIPDEWLQEKNVSINFDNTYNYNKGFSKQNNENLFTTLPIDFIPDQNCAQYFPNKAIYSDRQLDLINYKRNNWLLYRPASFFDFPLIYGRLIGIEGISDREVLAKFENKSMIYNAMLTIQTSSTKVAYIGNDTLFNSAPPLDFVETDLGYVGTQHEFFLKTEFGNVIVDSKRGQVFITSGRQKQDIGEASMQLFFTEQLKFKIADAFPNYDIDNAFKGVGLTGTYDTRYDRMLLTKLDYMPRYPDITYDPINDVFNYQGKQVELTDRNYFCSVSFTLSYSFKINAWVSFHSYLPNYYIGQIDQWMSGRNEIESFWTHNKDFSNYNTFYGVVEPYILEYPFSYKVMDEILQSVSDYTKVQQVIGQVRFVQLDDVYFNKSIIYNDQQCSGILELAPKPKNNLKAYLSYPIRNQFSKTIMVVKANNIYNYNTFWDVVKDYTQPIWAENCVSLPTDKSINQSNMDYNGRDFRKYQIVAKDARIRHILDNRGDVRLISIFILTDNQTSYK